MFLTPKHSQNIYSTAGKLWNEAEEEETSPEIQNLHWWWRMHRYEENKYDRYDHDLSGAQTLLWLVSCTCTKSLRCTFFFSLSLFPTVTEKVYESESYSETEDDHQTTKQAPKDPFPSKSLGSKQDEKKSQKKSSTNANKGTKQASIMGFFQKKWRRAAAAWHIMTWTQNANHFLTQTSQRLGRIPFRITF